LYAIIHPVAVPDLGEGPGLPPTGGLPLNPSIVLANDMFPLLF